MLRKDVNFCGRVIDAMTGRAVLGEVAALRESYS